jgi:hypothetical protein
MGSDLVLFDVRRATRWESWNKDSNLGSSTWQGENPPDGALINYYLAADASPVTITVATTGGDLVNRFTARGRAGLNRAVWNMSWSNPAGAPAGGGRGGRGGGGGLPAVPGRYTVTVAAAGRQASKTFELRGDPDVALSIDDYRAQFEAARKARTLMASVGELTSTAESLTRQIENLEAQVRGARVANLDQILEQTGSARARLEQLLDALRRPAPAMNYRQYPRLTEELRTLSGYITGPQARPTAGQLTVLSELEGDAAERTRELNEIIDTAIATLNRMLGDQPKVIAPGRGRGR